MILRKKMLMMVLASLIGFQPVAKARPFIIDYIEAIMRPSIISIGLSIGALGLSTAPILVPVGIYYGICNIRPITCALFRYAGTSADKMGIFFKYLSNYLEKADSVSLQESKMKFDNCFNEFKSEQNIRSGPMIYDHLVSLKTVLSINDLGKTKSKEGSVVGFLTEREKIKDMSNFNTVHLLNSKTFSNINTESGSRLKNKTKQMNMTEEEYCVYQKMIAAMNEASIVLDFNDFDQLLDYTQQQFHQHRRNINKKIINLCAIHGVCQEGTAKAVKEKHIDMKSSDIISRFHAGVQNRNKINESFSEVTETSTKNVLACFAQQ